MNNVHPIFRQALSNVIPLATVVADAAKALKPFVVSIYIGQRSPEEISVLAFTSCDAICKAIEIYFDGDEQMPEDMAIVAHPIYNLPKAA